MCRETLGFDKGFARETKRANAWRRRELPRKVRAQGPVHLVARLIKFDVGRTRLKNSSPGWPSTKGLGSRHHAAKRSEAAVVAFGGGVRTLCDFAAAEEFRPPQLLAGGDAPLGAAIHHGIDLVQDRKQVYWSNQVAFHRPWVFLISASRPSDLWRSAADRVRHGEASKAFSLFAVGVAGSGFRRPAPTDDSRTAAAERAAVSRSVPAGLPTRSAPCRARRPGIASRCRIPPRRTVGRRGARR